MNTQDNEMIKMDFTAKVSSEKNHNHAVVLTVIVHPSSAIYYKVAVGSSGRHTHEVVLPSQDSLTEFLSNGTPFGVILEESGMEHEHKALFRQIGHKTSSLDLSKPMTKDFFKRFIKLRGFTQIRTVSTQT
jgi:hypothetical protein